MTINFNKTSGALSIAIVGRLDTVTAPDLESFIGAQFDGASALTIDCKELAYVSSAGLRVLLATQKKVGKGGAMKLINVCEAVMEVFEMTGFADILVIE